MKDGSRHSDEESLHIAGSMGVSETVSVDDPAAGRVRIYVPRSGVPFAGHPLVEVAWWLFSEGHMLRGLCVDVGEVSIEAGPDSASIMTSPGRGVPWRFVETMSPHEMELADHGGLARHDCVWAWSDR